MISVDEFLLPKNVMSPLMEGFHNGVQWTDLVITIIFFHMDSKSEDIAGD
jgi:hypothetical protein